MELSTASALSRGLDYGSLRLQAISNNISNINTPAYKRREVTFSHLLDEQSDEVAPPKSSDSINTNSGFGLESGRPIISIDQAGSMRMDGNNVDIDRETADLASVEIYYSGVAQLTQNHFAGLKYAISGGR